MKLEVWFHRRHEGENPLAKMDSFAGVNAYDLACEATDVDALDPDRVNNDVPGVFGPGVVNVPLDYARACPHFARQGRVWVKVPPKSLNRFAHLEPIIDQDQETGEVFEVKFRWALAEYAILDAWREAGYPLEWDPAEPED